MPTKYSKLFRTSRYKAYVPPFFKSKKLYILALVLTSFLTLVWGSHEIASVYIKNTYLDIPAIKKTIVNLLQEKLGKAVDIGIIDYSLLSGIIIEDIKISQEEDFSENKMLFTSSKILLQTLHFIPKSMEISKIKIYDAKIALNTKGENLKKINLFFKTDILPEIQFINLNLDFLHENKSLIRTVHPTFLSIKKIASDIHIKFDDSLYFIPVTAKLSGKGIYKPASKELSIHADLDHYPLTHIDSIATHVLNLKVLDGSIYGKFTITKKQDEYEITSNFKGHQISGSFFLYDKFLIHNLYLLGNFSLKGKLDENGNSQVTFHRNLGSDQFKIEETSLYSNDEAYNHSLQISISEFSNLFRQTNDKKDLSIEGQLELDLNIEKNITKKKEWFSVTSKVKVSQFSLKHKATDLNIQLKELDLQVDKESVFKISARGKLQEEEIQIFSQGSLEIPIRKEDSSFYFISDITLDITLEKIILEKFNTVYNMIAKEISDSIAERQAKLLEQNYFILEKLFQDYLANLKVKSSMNFKNILISKKAKSLGEYTANLKIDTSGLTAKIDRLENSDSIFSSSLRVDYNKKMPFIDFKFTSKDLPWGLKTFRFCDVNFTPELLDIDFSFMSQGNNFSELLTHRNLIADATFKNVNTSITDTDGPYSLAETIKGIQPIAIKSLIVLAAHDIYYRNLEVKNDDISIKGYAAYKNKQTDFTFYGNLSKNTYTKISFSEFGSSYFCVKGN